jgi:hypothetical protein
MKTGFSLLLLVLAAAALAPWTATAHELEYGAFLSGPNESPPNASPGTGSVRVTIDLDLFTLRVEANFENLPGATTAAHIHAATAAPFSGTAGVATQTPSFAGFPKGVTSGTYDHTFDLTLASSYNPAFIAANGGTISTASNALFVALAEGRAYFNIHTTAFAGGEIRGFLVPVARSIVSITHPASNTIHLEGLGQPSAPNRIESSPDLSEGSFKTLVTVMADATGAFQYDDTSAGTQKFYRAEYP